MKLQMAILTHQFDEVIQSTQELLREYECLGTENVQKLRQSLSLVREVFKEVKDRHEHDNENFAVHPDYRISLSNDSSESEKVGRHEREGTETEG